ncbi:Serine threonine-protein kinase [Musa troglodytarum]|uniref:Serine threonine-protein kinase n=1 Tax=Musa troglodytarum TaxID=320322 RepID=A0A9E7L4T7_9LILI|nr:Serine threonine-protein kinase [Musa troglodytarum]
MGACSGGAKGSRLRWASPEAWLTLHRECLEWVVHRDLKPENILLDSEFEPKIGVIGLAKLSKRGGMNSGVSRARGTRGYVAPEWASNLPITSKVDVYSHGVVLLELTRGSRVWDWKRRRRTDRRAWFAHRRKERRNEEVQWIGDLVDGVGLMAQFGPYGL